MDETAALELAEVTASTGPLPQRSQQMLQSLRRLVPFDAAWLALAHTMSSSYTPVGSADLDPGVLQYLGGPQIAHDIEVTHTNPAHPPLSSFDLPYPAADLQTWAECFVPAGFRQFIGVALFDGARRHVGHLALLSSSKEPPSSIVRCMLQQLTPVLARGIDPLRSLAAAAQVVRGATAGTVLCRDGATLALPGLPGDALLDAESPVVTVARSYIDDGQVFTSFLWPRGGRHAPDGHVRVTVLVGPGEVAAPPLGVVVLSPEPDLHGLTPRELEVLGLLIDGCSNQQIAHTLVVAPRTVAAHLEHILVKLDAPSRTLAAVRAEREGLYVPLMPSSCRS